MHHCPCVILICRLSFLGTFVTQPDIAHLMGGIPHLSLQEITAHPRLPEARKAYVDAFLSVYEGDENIVRLLIEAGRFLVFQIIIMQHAAQDPALPETWATVGKLKQAMQAFGMSSERQIDILISRLRDRGFLEITRSDQDGRVRILKPTERMLGYDRDWLMAHHVPLAVLYPHRDYSGALNRDPVFQVNHRRTAMEFLGVAASLLMSLPELLVFFQRPGGVMFETAILQAAMNSPDGTLAAVSYADVGARFGYSRTHVRQVLRDAEAAGLMRLHGRGGHQVEVLPALWSGYDRGIATGMFLNDMMYAKATRSLPVS